MTISIVSRSQFSNNYFSPQKGSPEIKDKKKLSPNAVMYQSVFLPGLGQITNRQSWKLPIIYGGFAATAYSFIFARGYYLDYKQAYIYRIDGDSTTIDKFDPIYGTAIQRYTRSDQIKSLRDYYRRNMELSVIIAAGIYGLNIIDAYVSAQLRDFDISDDLTLSILPPSLLFSKDHYLVSFGCTLNIK